MSLKHKSLGKARRTSTATLETSSKTKETYTSIKTRRTFLVFKSYRIIYINKIRYTASSQRNLFVAFALSENSQGFPARVIIAQEERGRHKVSELLVGERCRRQGFGSDPILVSAQHRVCRRGAYGVRRFARVVAAPFFRL